MNTNKNTHPLINVLALIALMVCFLPSQVIAEAGTTTTYIHSDALGSPIAATDESGNVIWQQTYQPYGKKVEQVGNSDDQANEVGFTGHLFDDRTGLLYMGARYYDPEIGRFMSPDPQGFFEGNPHSFNRYAYANNNPYRYVDPDGELAVLNVRRHGFTTETAPIGVFSATAQVFVGVVGTGTAAIVVGPKEVGQAVLEETTGIDVPIPSLRKIAIKRVGRHMNPKELAKMKQTGKVQEGGGGQTRVADPANPNTFRNASDGDVYVEFDVPANRVLPHSKGTGRIPGPNSPDARVPGRNLADFEMPPATNIKEF